MTAPHFVNVVKVHNRRDCCSDRLSGYIVRVGTNMDHSKNPQCPGTYSGT